MKPLHVRRIQAALVGLLMAVLALVFTGSATLAQSTRDDAELHYKVALRALKDDHRRVAIEALRTTLDLDPGHALAHYTLASVLQQSAPDEALAHLDRALQLGLPDDEKEKSTELRVELVYQAARRRAGEVYSDPDTGLMWAVRDNGDDVDWKGARKYCEALTLRGFDDWRLPTIGELEHLSDRSQVRVYKIRVPLNVSACCPWSSTRVSGKPVLFAFNFGEVWPYDGPPLNCRALCVRPDPGR